MSFAESFVDGPNPSAPEDVRPPIATFPRSIWTNAFTSFSLDDEKVQEKYAAEIITLKDEAKRMLMAEGGTPCEKLVLIDTLERLGVAYHFEQEIEEHLDNFYRFHLEEEENGQYDLFAAALQFRLLRQHRYHVSCGVFEKFKDKGIGFKEILNTDAKGLLCLYEATHVRTHGEDILEEALQFTTHHLNLIMLQLQSPFQDQVQRALLQPLHKGVPRIETLNYIHFYEKDDAKNEMLLKFAKLDFNFVQNLHRQELCGIMRWWRGFDLLAKLPYSRDRMVECYLWGLVICPEPRYCYARKMLAITMQMVTNIDDTYDNYATLREARLFTEILHRWDISEIDRLPDNMKVLYRFILSVYEDFEREATKEGTLFAVHYAKESVKQLSRAYYEEMKWFMGRQLPTFDAYLTNALVTSCIYVMYTVIIPGMKSVSKETIDWLLNQSNKLIIATTRVGRYLENLASNERENMDGQMLTAVDCYMKQYGTSKEETVEKFLEGVEDGWKDMNAQWMTEPSTHIPKEFLSLILNYGRISVTTYKHNQDGYSDPEKVLGPQIRALILDPITI